MPTRSESHTRGEPLPKPTRVRRQKGSSLDDLLFGEPINLSDNEQLLWCAVINQMRTDALSNSRKAEFRHRRREALAWLTGNSRDFRMVCELAGYEPDYIRERAIRELASHVAKPPQMRQAGRPQPLVADIGYTLQSLSHAAFSARPARLQTIRVNLSADN